MLICRPGTLRPRVLLQPDVTDFFLLFTTFDERKSWYLDYNIRKFCTPPCQAKVEDLWFETSNKFAGTLCHNLWFTLSSCCFGNFSNYQMTRLICIHVLCLKWFASMATTTNGSICYRVTHVIRLLNILGAHFNSLLFSSTRTVNSFHTPNFSEYIKEYFGNALTFMQF